MSPDVTGALPTTPRRYAESANAPERAIQQLGEFATAAVTHPIQTAKGLVTAPLQSASRTFLTPVVGERNEINPKTGLWMYPSLAPGATVTQANTPSAETSQEFNRAAVQTMANAASLPLGEGVSAFTARMLAPVTDRVGAATIGRAVGGAVGAFPVGAAYSPDDPLAGGLAMSTLGLAAPFASDAVSDAARHAVNRVTTRARTSALAGGPFDLAPAVPPITERPADLAQAQGAGPATAQPPAPIPQPKAPGLRRRIAETIDPTIATTLRTDAFTGTGSQDAFKRALPAAESDPAMGVATGDISGLKSLNDTHGHAAGDQAILRAAGALSQAASEAGPAYRVFRSGKGDEFSVLGPTEGLGAVAQRAEDLYGVQEHGAGVRTAFPMGVGGTFAEADQAAYARKAATNATYGIASRSASLETQPSTAGSSSVTTLPTSDIRVDPARFQFKAGTSAETGAGRELAGVEHFNPDLAGVISVWRDPENGGTYVVNGHHRVELAQRLGVPSLDVRYLNSRTAEEARATGALINIAEGRGTPLDAAKFFRDTRTGPDDLEARGVSLRGAVAARGLALSKLAPDLFDRVARGDIPEETGAAIGKVLEAPEQQRAAVHLIERSGRRLSGSEVENVARQVRDAGSTSATQETLFGTEETALSLAVDRARLSDAISKDIARDARLFGYVSREGRAEELARAGNVIDVGRSSEIAGEAAGHGELFDRFATRSGPVGDILTAGARRLAQGEKLATVKADIAPQLREAIRATLSGREGSDVREPARGIGERESAPGESEGGSGAGAAPAAGREEAQGVAPRTSIETAETGRPFAQTLLRGEGLETSPYNALGAQVPILGSGRYGTRSQEYARTFGPTITEHSAKLSNPLVITSDAEWRRLTSDAGWQYPNPFGSPPDQVEGDIARLRSLIESRGHDGVIVRVPADERVGKTLQKVFGESQVVEFAPRSTEADPYTELGRAQGEDAYADLGQAEEPGLFEARDLFGNEEPEPAEAAQGALFGDAAGRAESRSLAQTEAAYRAELPKLRTLFERTTDPTQRAQLAARIADMERLVNRGGGIGADELRARIAAGQHPSLTADGEPAGGWAQLADRGPEPERTSTEPQTPDEAAVRVTRLGDTLRRMFAPETRTPAAGITARVIREHAAQMARQLEMAREATRDLAKTFDAMPEAARLDFMDRIETGQPQPTLTLQQAATLFRQLLDGKRDEIRALGTGKLDHYLRDYFPHLWQDPTKAEGVIARLMSKRSL
ncbi:MAG TPA: diguanylate cyclase, partial [Gemmatimonadaceae bacterium]